MSLKTTLPQKAASHNPPKPAKNKMVYRKNHIDCITTKSSRKNSASLNHQPIQGRRVRIALIDSPECASLAARPTDGRRSEEPVFPTPRDRDSAGSIFGEPGELASRPPSSAEAAAAVTVPRNLCGPTGVRFIRLLLDRPAAWLHITSSPVRPLAAGWNSIW